MERRQEIMIIIESIKKDIIDVTGDFKDSLLTLGKAKNRANRLIELNNQLLKYIEEHDSLTK